MADEPTYRSNQPIGNPQGITENSPDASQEVAQRGLFDTYQTGILNRMIELTRDQNPDWDYVYADSETPIPDDYPMDTILDVAAAAGGGGADVLVAVDAAAVADYLGATAGAGALRVDDSTIGKTDGGNFITLAVKDEGITYAKMQHIATDSLLGRDTAGVGDVENITLGTGLAMSGAGALNCTVIGGLAHQEVMARISIGV